jgi:UDP-N-acetylmuramoyl-tripeptide--D-alanyl-D-alanine ligase
MANKEPLWTPGELAAATKGRWLSKPGMQWDPIRVSYDTSNTNLPNHIAVMVTPVSWGRNRKESVGRALKLAQSGAACVIIQREQKDRLPKLPNRFPVLLVKNTRHALRDLGIAARKRFRGKVIAITGTVGKTTTRQMLHHLLDRQGGAVATRWNNNNIAGVQRTMAYTPAKHGYSLIEMGFGMPLDGIKTSSLHAKPHVALLTTISNAHIDVFSPDMLQKHSGLELLADHKSMIFEGLVSGGPAVVGRSNPMDERVLENARKKTDRVISYGFEDGCEARITDLELSGAHSSVKAEIDGTPIEYRINLPGKHMAYNALGALTAVWAAGGDLAQAANDMAEFEAVTGRAKVSDIPIPGGGKGKLIDDSFNATIASVVSSFEVLDLMTPEAEGRRIAVLGDVMHVGPDEVEQHVGLSTAAVENNVDLVFTNGPLMKHLYDALPEERRASHTSTMPDLYRDLVKQLQPGDIVAIKSGRGSGGLGDRAFMTLGQCLRNGSPEWPS